MVETINTVAANLDGLFTTWIQRHNPQHNPNSSFSTPLLSKAAPLLVGPIPAIVIKLKECFTSKETTPSFTSVSPGLLLAPQGLQRGSLTLSSIDFAAVDQTFADTGKPHLALQELGRQLTSSTEFSERTREWVGAAFKEIDQFAHHYAYENSNNPLQAKIDTVGGIIHGGCSLGKDLVTLQVQLSLGPFLKPHEMQTVLQHIDNASTTVGAHYTQTIQAINPRFNPNSAAYKVGYFTGKYILPTIGPGVVRARPPNPTYLTTKAAQMLETLEARLAARSEAFFPELHPAFATGPRSHPPLMRSTKPNLSTTLPGAPKAPPKTKTTSLTKTSKPQKKSEDVFAPDRKLPRHTRTKEPLPDVDAPHTQLGSRISKKTKKPYPQAREFDASGKPVRDIDFTDHGKPHEHPNPHQHVYKDSQTGGTLQRKSKKGENPGHPVPEWSYE